MSGGGRSGRGRGRRGGGGGSYGGRGGRHSPHGSPHNHQHTGPQPVEFHLYALPSFNLEGCPALVRPPSVPDALRRLTMADRTVLGDILYWFRSKAAEEPSAKLVMWQATRDDKSWLSSFAANNTPELDVSTVETGSNKYLQFKLKDGVLALSGEGGPNAQVLAIGGVAAVALAVVGVVLGVTLRGSRRR
eukprot:gene8672-8853_t